MKLLCFAWSIFWRFFLLAFLVFFTFFASGALNMVVTDQHNPISNELAAISGLIMYITFIVAVFWASKTSYPFKNYVRNFVIAETN